MNERRTFLKTFMALLGLGLAPAFPKRPRDESIVAVLPNGDVIHKVGWRELGEHSNALYQNTYISTPSYPNSTVGDLVYSGDMPIGYCVGKAANGDSIIQVSGMFETKGRAVSQAATVR